MAVSSKSARTRAKPDEVFESQFERVLANASRLGTVFLGVVVLLIVLKVGGEVLAPVFLAIVIGLMFGPAADWFEARRIPPALSALLVVLLLLAVIAGALLLFAVPLSNWIGKIPEMWAKLQTELAMFKGPLDSAAALQNQIASIFGEPSAMTVRVSDGGSAITGIAMIAPAIGSQVLLFLASLYFFVATREHIRISMLSLCVTRRMRWRTAHVFSDVEAKVSRFLLSVTVINVCLGVVVSLAMWALGAPSPILWGVLATITNYVPYVGQAVMVVVLVSVGLGTQNDLPGMLAPVGAYLFLTLIEGQIITPHVLGRTMTLNPFLIFLSIAFWLWTWGPIGGFISVPSLLIVQSLLSHVLPSKEVLPRKRIRRTARMSEKDVVLANAAQVVKERAEEEAAGGNADKRLIPPAGTAPDGSSATA